MSQSRKNAVKWSLVLALTLVVIGGAARVVASFGATADPIATAGWQAVIAQQGDLTISSVFAGSIRGAELITIESNVSYGQQVGVYSSTDRVYPRLLWVIEEGRYVKQGDLLAEISSEVVERQIQDYEQVVSNVRLALAQAEEALSMAELQAKADIMEAEHNLTQAQLLLTQYVEGEYPQQVAKQEMQVTLSESELERARDVLQWSERLHGEGFITKTEFDADRLKLDRAKVDLQTQRNKLKLLKDYDYRRTLAQRQSTARQREFLLTKARFIANSRIRSAESRLQAYQKVMSRVEEHYADLHQQLRDTKVLAPADGMIIYASTNNPEWDQDPVGMGMAVRRGTDLFRLYRGSTLAVDLRVPPSKLQQLKVGQEVYVRPDGQPDTVVAGRVTKVGIMPDADYRNPFHTWYPVEVTLGPNSAQKLSVGVNCSAEVVVNQVPAATLVPIQAVQWKAPAGSNVQQPTVMVSTPGGVIARTVELGADDTQHVQIVSGLNPGEQVLMPPDSTYLPPVLASGAE